MVDSWKVYTDGDEYRAGFEILEDAFAFVTANIVRPRGSGVFQWRYHLDEHNGTAHFYWLPPVRDMTSAETKAEIDSMNLPLNKRLWTWWKYYITPTQVYDETRAQLYNEFPLGYVAYVRISSVERKFTRGSVQKFTLQEPPRVPNGDDSTSKRIPE